MNKHQENMEKRPGMNLSLWRKLLAYAFRYPWTLVQVAIFGMGTAVGEIVLVYLLGAFVDAVTAGESLVGPGILYATTTVLMCACIFGFIRATGGLKTRVSHDLRQDGFHNLQELSFSFYDRHSVGWLMARMTSDCERLSVIMTWGILDFLWGFTMIAGIAVVCLSINFTLGAVMLSVLPVLALSSIWFQRRLLKVSRTVRKTNSKLTAAYSESLLGVATTKTFTREDQNLEEFRDLSGTMLEASLRNSFLTATYLPVVHLLGSVGLALALARGGISVSLGELSVGTLFSFLFYARYLIEPIQELARLFAELQTAQASGERIVGLIETVPEIRDAADLLRENPNPSESVESIEFARASFAYSGSKPVLSEFDLTVHAGQTVAIVGPTGSGKTTITSLLCRFYEPTSGEVRINGRDYRERPLAWLQSRLGIVLQEPHLFSGTLAENIGYGALDASIEEIRQAAETVGADTFIEKLPAGYETQVGEQGTKLSIGQKQLVSFARALLRDPEILVMDEATSSIDTETELRIQQALRKVLRGRTSFVIAHRLSTIREADRILVVQAGKIVEQGSHAQLLTQDGVYASMVRRSAGQGAMRDPAHPGQHGERPAPA